MKTDKNTIITENTSAPKKKGRPPKITLPEQHLTAVFMDYENIYCLLLKENTNLIRLNFFTKFYSWCERTGRKLCKKMAYCNFDYHDLLHSHHQTLLNSLGVQSIHTSNNGKNCADLQIAIDIMEYIFNYPEIEEYIIISNDKDMIPVLNAIRMHGKSATIVTIGQQYDYMLENYANNHIGIEDVLAVDAPNILLDSISGNIYKFLEENLQRQILDKPSKQGKLYSLERLVSSFSNHFRIMTYEVASILKTLHDTGKVCFAEYQYYGKPNIAVIPDSLKNKLLKTRWIKETDIKSNFDVDALIDNEYTKAKKYL